MGKGKLTWENAPQDLTLSQAAQLIKVHLNRLRSWITTGDLPARETPAGRFMIDKFTLQTFWRSRQGTTESNDDCGSS
jgi:hypothetical protein